MMVMMMVRARRFERKKISRRKRSWYYVQLFLALLLVVLPLTWWTHLFLLFRAPTTTEDGASSNHRSNLTIIAIGCNRVDGLLRAMNSAKYAHHVPPGITLHICIDGCVGNEEVHAMARAFTWPHGSKQITVRSTAWGLAKHITHCWEHPQPNEWALFLEDDVLLSPKAFVAFAEGVQIRDGHDRSDAIMGIALHDSRVNQYCWRDRIQKMSCPRVQEICNTESDTWSQLGSLSCLHQRSRGYSWNLNQFPSSWGAWYEGRAWSLYKDYFAQRIQLSVGESLLLAVPHSFSNEWEASWKRYLLELMFRAGWTVMYRTDPEHRGYSTTLRTSGVHTMKKTSDDRKIQSEEERRCLVSTPLADTFTVDPQLTNNANLIRSLDYCAGDTSTETLSAQGVVSASLLQQHCSTQSPSEALTRTLRVMQIAIEEGQDRHGVAKDNVAGILSSEYSLTFLSKAEIVMVTSFASVAKDFARTAKHFETFGGTVHFLVAAPGIVCRRMMRGNIFATCVDESHFTIGEGNKLPVIRKVLQAAAEYAGPKVQWIGVMNGDITFDAKQLFRTLQLMAVSDPCAHHCALVGQRYDIDWKTRKEKLHPAWGMDYFIFNLSGLDFLLRDGVVPPMTFGLVRWDSWLMGFLALEDEVNVIDATEVLRVEHYMNFRDEYASKTNEDRWNLRLADERFHMGRTDNANFRVNGSTNHVNLLNDKKSLQHKFAINKRRFQVNLMMERVTNYTYTPGPMPTEYFLCLCDYLGLLVPGNFTSNFCAPGNHLKFSRKKKLATPIYFHQEVFQEIAERQGLPLRVSGAVALEAKGSNSKMCCMFTEPYGDPVRAPDKFWTFEAGKQPFSCLARTS